MNSYIKKTYWIFLFLVITGVSYSQPSGYEKYSVDYTFKDGIYLSFKDFANNEPVNFASFVSPTYRDDEFLELLIKQKKIRYFDEFGNLRETSSRKVWGYSKNNSPHILWAGKFNPIPYIGTVSHFVATVRVRYETIGGPMYSHYYYGGGHMYYREEVRQFVIDMETGRVHEFDERSVQEILKRDEPLGEEFDRLRNRDKDRLRFYYIKQYNERNPLYLPKN